MKKNALCLLVFLTSVFIDVAAEATLKDKYFSVSSGEKVLEALGQSSTARSDWTLIFKNKKIIYLNLTSSELDKLPKDQIGFSILGTRPDRIETLKAYKKILQAESGFEWKSLRELIETKENFFETKSFIVQRYILPKELGGFEGVICSAGKDKNNQLFEWRRLDFPDGSSMLTYQGKVFKDIPFESELKKFLVNFSSRVIDTNFSKETKKLICILGEQEIGIFEAASELTNLCLR